MNNNTCAMALLFIMISSLPTAAPQGAGQGQGEREAGVASSELEQSMEKMHADMHSVKPSGDNDVDFVRVMLSHHDAAIDMARTELAHGKDPQMRRLAQEIIADQQSEIDLMRLWLKRHEASSKQ